MGQSHAFLERLWMDTNPKFLAFEHQCHTHDGLRSIVCKPTNHFRTPNQQMIAIARCSIDDVLLSTVKLDRTRLQHLHKQTSVGRFALAKSGKKQHHFKSNNLIINNFNFTFSGYHTFTIFSPYFTFKSLYN